MTLSKEELRSIIENDHVQCGDAAAMARELLERRERDKQEPVAWTDKRNLDYINQKGRETSLMWASQNREPDDTALYAVPPAPVVQVPDESDPRDAFEKEFPIPAHVSRCGNGYVVHEYNAWSAHDYVKKWEGWNACRAAMLKGGQS